MRRKLQGIKKVNPESWYDTAGGFLGRLQIDETLSVELEISACGLRQSN
jgi:hypothetical protein